MIRKRGVGRTFREMKVLLAHNRRLATFDESLLNTLKLFLLGFRRDALKIYSINHFDELGDYISHVEMRNVNRLGHRAYRVMMDDKTAFPMLFADHAVSVPDNLFAVCDGVCFDLRRGWQVADLASLIRAYGKPIVVKPADGLKGQGVGIVTTQGDTIFMGEEPVTPEGLAARLSGAVYIGCPFVEPHPAIARFYPGATGTMRVHTFYDEERRRGEILCAVLKIPTRESAPIDSSGSGGICALVNLETGRLSSALSRSGRAARESNRVLSMDVHPDTGERIEGTIVPNVDRIKQEMVAIATRLPLLPSIGWDVAVTQEGFTIIEGNPAANFDLLQLHYPVLRNERFRRLLERNDILTRRAWARYLH